MVPDEEKAGTRVARSDSSSTDAGDTSDVLSTTNALCLYLLLVRSKSCNVLLASHGVSPDVERRKYGDRTDFDHQCLQES